MNRKALALFGATALLGVSTASSAYVLLSPARTWSSPPNYIVDNRGLTGVTDGNGGITRTINAIQSSSAWNGAGSGTLITASSGSVAGFSLGDGVPMLNFTDPLNACTGNCLAATFTGYYSGSTIYDADIVTNTSQPWASLGESCSGEYYIEGVMVHETGHALGLAHTSVGGATMYPSVSACNNGPASTESDDENGINALYGGGGGGGGGSNPNSCVSNGTCGGQAPGGCWCDWQCQWFGDCCSDGPC
ncbi:MAG: matrixin family metalloprotease [Myxococcota bacterium]